MTLDNDRKRVILGQVGKVHGIKGWLRLNSFTTPPDKILAYARLLGAIEGELQVLEIDQYRRQGETLVVHFKGFDNPETSRSIVSSKSVDLIVVFSLVAVIKTQLSIGRVDLVGVAFDNFCKACWSSFFDVENFINLNFLLLVCGNNYLKKNNS